MTNLNAQQFVVVSQEEIATYRDWIRTGLDLNYWLDHGEAEYPDDPKTFALAKAVDNYLDSYLPWPTVSQEVLKKLLNEQEGSSDD